MANQINKQDYRILLVDDDKGILDYEVSTLQEYGYQVCTALSGESAIEIMRSSHIDIVIIDYYMDKEGMTGEETVIKIREFDHEVVILLQTGYAQEQPAIRMLESLKIQGYYDKSEGRAKLQVLVLSAIRACEQLKETKKMMEKVEFAHYTIQQMREDQSRMIEQVRLASLGQKIGSLFHDMSNPLTAVEGNINIINDTFAKFIEEAEKGNIPVSEIIDTSKKMMERCTTCYQRITYIRDMRSAVVAHSRQETANKWEKFPISEMIEQVRLFAEDDIKRYRCTVSINNHVPDSVKISGKKVSLVQALGNLITNSAQAYEEKSGNIEVNITEKDGIVEFTIKDWAGGIPPHVKEKLFTEMVTTKGVNGSGVGVYSTYLTIVDYFGGKMWFESIEGEGTTFYITIPYTK